MKTYNQFKEAAALAIPVASKLAIPALGGIIKGVKAITNRETGLSDSEKARVADLMKKVGRAKRNRRIQDTEKDILDYGREKEGIAERPKKVTEENKHRDAKLLYQYKDVTNPKKSVDPIKALKLKKA